MDGECSAQIRVHIPGGRARDHVQDNDAQTDWRLPGPDGFGPLTYRRAWLALRPCPGNVPARRQRGRVAAAGRCARVEGRPGRGRRRRSGMASPAASGSHRRAESILSKSGHRVSRPTDLRSGTGVFRAAASPSAQSSTPSYNDACFQYIQSCTTLQINARLSR